MITVTGSRCSQQRQTRFYAHPSLFFVLMAGLMVLSGCAHNAKDYARPQAPAPDEYDSVEPEPDVPKNVPALLREADEELKKANAAHENGEHKIAFEHYQRMLQLLLEADLDPSLYYESSGRFEEILRFYMKHAHLYHHPERRLGSSHTGDLSDIVVPFPLPQPVLDEIAELQNSYPNTFQRGLNRSARYLPHIQEEFRAAGLPEDLAWLAMVESMFQPKVVSHAGAGGMWQFMRATGRRYHLRMDSHIDERYNWHSATRAASEYLKYLHDFFDGDWSLAVTAYNMGEGGMDRAIKANGGERDLWTLFETPPASDRIKQESKKFYPRLLAYIIVANAPEQYGFSYTPETYEDVLRIPVQGGYALRDLDEAMGLSRGTLAALNPDLLQEATPPQGEYAVAVPRAKRDQFMAALRSVNTIRHAGTHRVRPGETVNQIAQRYGVCDKELMRINHIRTARSLQANQVLQIPDSGLGRGGAEVVLASAPPPAAAPKASTAAAATRSSQSAGPEATHTVKAGDTLYDIARAHKVSIADLQKLNSLQTGSHIRVGQVLKLGLPAQPAAPAAPRYHEVKPGEYPGVIAKLYGVSTRDLLAWNNLTPQSVIRVGDRLAIAGEGTAPRTAAAPAPAAQPVSITHKVAPGETASAIATRYGVKTSDLLAWNNLTAKSILRVGQNLSVKSTARNTAQRDASDDVQVAQAQRVVHTVRAGQNPSTIARDYRVRVSDLFKWNNWADQHVLRVGDEVAIYRD